MNTRSIMFLLLILSGSWVLPDDSAEAQTVKEAEELTHDESMVVTATRTKHLLREVPVSISLIKGEDIERLATEGTVADVLKDVPGVELSDTSLAGGKRIMIRGDHGNRVLVLVDGQKVSEQKSVSGVPLLVDVNNIQQIEVVKGPSSVLYGSDAIGGVVNIITKKDLHKEFGGSVSAGFNSSTEGAMGSVNLAGTKSNFSYRVSGAKTDHGDRETPEGTLENTSYIYDSVNAYMAYRWDGLKLGAVYEDFAGDIESTYDAPIPPMTGFFMDLPEWNREKVGVFLESLKPGERLAKYRVDLFTQDTFKDFLNSMEFQFAPGMPPSTIDIHTQNELNSSGLLFQADWTLHPNHYVITGLEYSKDKLEATEFTEQIGFGPFPIVTDFFFDSDMQTLALFAQDEWNITEKFLAVLGVRQTFLEFGLNDTDAPNLPIGDNDDSEPVGSIGLVYSPNDVLSFRGNLSQGFRYGTLQQLFIGTSHGSSTPTFPNPELKPETSDNIEMGLRYFSTTTNLDVAVFFNAAEDYITTTLVDGVRYFANIDEAESYGAELLFDYRLPRWGLRPFVEANLLRRSFQTADHGTYKTGHPELTGRLGIDARKEFGTGAVFSGKLYARHAGSAEEEYLSEGTLYLDQYDSWTTLNLSLNGSFGRKNRVNFGLDANNLTDKSYTVATETLMAPGRHFNLRFSTKF